MIRGGVGMLNRKVGLRFQKHLYFGEGIKDADTKKILKKMEKNPLLYQYYVIAFSANPHSQLEIVSTRQLIQPYYRKYPLDVVGVGASYDDTLEIVEKIVQECLDKRGDLALKEYLTCCQSY